MTGSRVAGTWVWTRTASSSCPSPRALRPIPSPRPAPTHSAIAAAGRLAAGSVRLVGRIERLLRPEALAGGPGGEQTHGLLGLRTRFGRVDGEGQPVFGFHVHDLVGQSHLPDHR